jgi:hypothetical protein
LRRELQLAARHELPDAEITEGTLKVTPLVNTVPEAYTLMRQAYAMLPHVKVTDLLPHQGDHATVRLCGLPKGKAPSGIARWRTPRSSIDGTDGSISSSRSNLALVQ